MIKKKSILLLLLIAIIPIVSTEIYIGNLNNFYNEGDELTTTIDLVSNAPEAEHLIVDISCGNFTKNIYNQYFNLKENEEKNIIVETSLTKDNLDKIKDTCRLLASYGISNSLSNYFSIVREVDMEYIIDIKKYLPGKNVNISGTAIKKSGNPLNGFLRAEIKPMGIFISESIANGEFEFEFKIPENAPSGAHDISLRAYELNKEGDVSNEGKENFKIEIIPILKKIDINLNNENVFPEEDFTYKVVAYDQANSPINEKIGVTIYEPKNFPYLKRIVDSDRDYEMIFPINESQGYWKIEAVYGDLTKTKLFYLEPVKKLSLSLGKKSLIVKNIGNVFFEGPLEVNIGSETEIEQLKLEVGQIKELKIYAPNGDYKISANYGTGELVLGNTLLTGKAVSVGDIQYSLSEIIINPLFWTALIILVILFIIYIIVQRKLKRKDLDNDLNQTTVNNILSQNNLKKFDAKPKLFQERGFKEPANVIALKAQETPENKETINSALSYAKSQGAKVYSNDEYKIILLSPFLTKNKDNELKTIKIATKIQEILKEYNRKFKEKIIFGIGVNYGEIISEVSGNQFKFTSIGNIISVVKRIAQASSISNMETLISDSIRRRVTEGTKFEKVKGKDYWKITGIIDRSKYDSFLHSFKNRNK